MYAHEDWMKYKSGALDTCTYEKDENNLHAVLFVGYTKKNWIIKNSWSNGWGDGGFFKVAIDNPCPKIKKITFPTVA